MLTCCSVLPCGVFGAAEIQSLEFFCCASDDLFYVDACNCHGQQTNSTENGEAAAYVVGNYEHFPAFLHCHVVQNAAACVGNSGDALACFFCAVLLDQQTLEHTECQSGFQSGAGFGDNSDIEVLIAQTVQGVHHAVGGQAVAYEDDVNVAFLHGGAQQVNSCASTQIATADTDNDQSLRTCADLFSASDDLLQFGVCDGLRQLQPADEVVTLAGAFRQHAVCVSNCCVVGTITGEEGGSAGQINFNHRIEFLSYMYFCFGYKFSYYHYTPKLVKCKYN